MIISQFKYYQFAIDLAQKSCYGQYAVDKIVMLPYKFSDENSHYYDFIFDFSCSWNTKVRIIPRFTNIFEFYTDINGKPIFFYLLKGNRKPLYSNIKYDKINSKDKCLLIAKKYIIWRTCFFIDIFIQPYLSELKDVMILIKYKIKNDMYVPDFFYKRKKNFICASR